MFLPQWIARRFFYALQRTHLGGRTHTGDARTDGKRVQRYRNCPTVAVQCDVRRRYRGELGTSWRSAGKPHAAGLRCKVLFTPRFFFCCLILTRRLVGRLPILTALTMTADDSQLMETRAGKPHAAGLRYKVLFIYLKKILFSIFSLSIFVCHCPSCLGVGCRFFALGYTHANNV